MAVAASSRPRVSVDGKFFRLGEKKFYVKGLAYGPFAPNAAGQPLCLAGTDRRGLRADPGAGRQPHPGLSRAGQMVSRPGRRARAQGAGGHPLEQAPLLPGLARRSRPRRAKRCAGPCSPARGIRRCLRSASPTRFRPTSCAGAARRLSPTSLMTSSTWPSRRTRSASAPSPIIRPPNSCARRSVDFVCFNVYLHHRAAVPELSRAPANAGRIQAAAAGGIRHGLAARGRGRAGGNTGMADRMRVPRRAGRRGGLQLHRRLVAGRPVRSTTGRWA